MKSKIVFIINPISGKGKGREIEPEIKKFFKDYPYEVKTFFTTYAGHAKEIVNNEIANNPTVIVACGGDGTINEVAQTLIGHDILLGIIPIGSGNGLATNLNISKDLTAALNTIISKNSLAIDVGKINDRYFFSNIGLGIDAVVIDRYTEKKQRNFIGYLKASLWSLFNFKSVKYKIEFDDEQMNEDDYYFVFCSNSNVAGYGITFTPDAKLNDGKIDVLCVKKLNFFQLIMFGYAVMFKSLKRFDKAFLKQVERVSFVSNDKELQIQIDGEAFKLETSRIDVEILSKPLSVVVPKSLKF